MCEPTCQSEPNEACPLGCGPPKCECLPGFVRDQGRCIRRDQCPASEPPQTCGRNEHFVACSSMCEPTCQSEPNEACPLGCGPPKCECLPGFVRDQGSSMCEPTCQSEPNEACPLGCGPPKCECLPGFVRDQGRCIRRDQCPASEPPQMCGPNERFAACSSMCEPTCQSEPNEACALGCGAPKCECLPGFVRDQGRCIRRDQCPASEPPQTCGRNEHFVTCSSMCEPTCLSRPNEPCPRGCGPPKCECLSGFVRYEGRCIRRDQCPASADAVLVCQHDSQCPTGTTCVNGNCVSEGPKTNAPVSVQNQLKACTANNDCERDSVCFEGFCHHIDMKK
ncbi:Cysteine-rich with EGF-like domain protein 2-B [Toxocara canis]|uniref:Cysteine-rich with EGF-like domain protein 2-B n=1 Tax=Toxocara canis TaxID=6265 RepID=A0A0B2VKP5_TOXCA|nr:Cysteine-rich with EGF-like domain protein 2-B [Toxocara canis]